MPEGGAYETVGGYMMAGLGRVAEVGDKVEAEGGILEVERMDGRRIDRIKFIPEERTPADELTPVSDSRESGRGGRGSRIGRTDRAAGEVTR